MSSDSNPEGLPGKTRRIARRNSEGDISPGLREHITQAARKIRGVHKAELADALKADRAGRLFRSIIRPNGKPVGSLTDTTGSSGEGLGSLVGDLGGLLSDAIRTGTGLLEGPLTDLTQAWMATVMGLASKPNLRMPSAAGSVPAEASQPQRSAARQMPSMAADAAVPGGQARDTPTEAMLRGVFRQFMPMLLTALSQGGDGHGLAETVITLFGRPTYDHASGLGRDRIMQFLKGEPDLWAQVAPIEAKFSKFLDEFTGYDVWTEQQARQANEQNIPR
jgi:hypothetical protein